MKREEAIQVLESMKSEENYNALIDLCNMAMESLQKDIERHEMAIRASERHLSIVRCKDCRQYIPKGLTDDYGWCCEFRIDMEGHDFCSRGERREE